MRKQYRQTNLSVDESGNVFNRNNGNRLYPVKGMIEGIPVETLLAETWKQSKDIPAFVKEVEKVVLDNHVKPIKAVTAKRKGKGLRDQIMPNETTAKRTAEKNSTFEGYYVINKVEYPSALAAHKATGMRLKTIIEHCKLGMSFKPR